MTAKHFVLAAMTLGVVGFVGAAEDAFPLITKRVQSWVDRGYYPGCSVWIAQGDKVLYERIFGSNTADTEVYIASAGKWLASAAILAVVDEGKLSLDDPKGKVTLQQMFSHTSGYPPYQPTYKPADNYQTTAESVKHLLPLPANFPPGERFEYGGLAMQVAGRMAEVATGKDWETIFQEKIAKPLGMSHTRFTPVDPGHTPMLGGAAISSMHDYSRFLTMIADGGEFEGHRILSEKAIVQMEADQVGHAVVKREEFVERVRGNTHHGIYGLGMWREEVDASGNATLISSPSWAGTYPWIDKRNDIRGVIIAHVDTTVAGKAQFSGFWTSPVLMNMVRAELGWKTPRDLPNFEEGIIPANNGDLAYEAAGAGEPVVLLHGHSFDRRMWNPQFAELAKHYRVIRYDLRGYGLSDMPTEGRDFLHAEDLCALLDHLKIDKAHIVGLSLGGYVVGDFLAVHPDRILSATIASGAVFEGPASRKLDADELASRLVEIEKLRAEGIDSLKTRWRENLLRSTGAKAESIRPLLTEMIDDWSAWQPLHVEPPILLGNSVLERLAQVNPQVKVLWIAGANDKYQAQFNRFAAVLPQMKLVVLPDAGHLSNLEQPQAFTQTLQKFWSEIRR
jgi:pimeloyl-ACP methyl ester carboxylesterase/CubicO group peptidase (beta-lactamase class C family)